MIKKILILSIFITTLLQASSFDKGMQYFIKGKYSQALPHFINASNKGHKEAQFYLANMYEKGLGVQKNNKKATELFKLYTNKSQTKTNIEVSTIKKKPRVAKKRNTQKQTRTTKSKAPFSKRYKKYYNPKLQGAEEVKFN